MKVLHVMPYCPVPPNFGGALRNYHLLKHFAANHEVTVLCYGTQDDVFKLRREFDIPLERLHVVSRPWTRKLRKLAQFYALFTGHSFFHMLIGQGKDFQERLDVLLSANNFDVVQMEFTPTGCFHFATNALKVLDAHNVEHDNFRRMSIHAASMLRKFYYRREHRKLIHEERAGCSNKDALFVTSDQDRSLIERLAPGIPKFVVPNGVDPRYFRPLDDSQEESSMVFTGMMGYVPNYDGIHYFLDEIFPCILKEIPRAKIYVVGNRPPRHLLKRAADNVIITGYVDDVRPYVARAGVYVVPLRMGSGTRLKVLEALSMKKPIVTTSIGCEGIELSHGNTAFIEDEPKAFASRVIELLKSPSMRQQFVERGYELVRSKYDWLVITEEMDKAFATLLNGTRAVAEKPTRKAPDNMVVC